MCCTPLLASQRPQFLSKIWLCHCSHLSLCSLILTTTTHATLFCSSRAASLLACAIHVAARTVSWLVVFICPVKSLRERTSEISKPRTPKTNSRGHWKPTMEWKSRREPEEKELDPLLRKTILLAYILSFLWVNASRILPKYSTEGWFARNRKCDRAGSEILS